MRLILLSLFLTLGVTQDALSQLNQAYIQELKEDRRGPFKDIKWFCEDGTIREARDPCPEPLEGVQHARFKDRVAAYAKRDHIFLDQILTGTNNLDYWDASNHHSRLKQYNITNFLQAADDGWILRKAKLYRGAKQIEDERAWGQDFLTWVVADDNRLADNFLLIRQAADNIPHGEESKLDQKVRAYSKLLAESDERFMNIRIKMHNSPSSSDLPAVIDWKKEYYDDIDDQSKEYLDELLKDMKVLYKPFEIQDLAKYTTHLKKGTDLEQEIADFLKTVDNAPAALRVRESLDLIKSIRAGILTQGNRARVDMLDLSNYLEKLAVQDDAELAQNTLQEKREKLCYLTEGLYGAGYIEEWEYDAIQQDLNWFQMDEANMYEVSYFNHAGQKLVQWSTQMLQSLYAEPIQKFRDFEPMVEGFIDDNVRSSLVLPTGNLVSALKQSFNDFYGTDSRLLSIKKLQGIQGLNPGIARGKLHVLTTLPEDMDLKADDIYAFDRPPTEMKPVAGILNVKEGNPVSHVQLLARNLAIPNALISLETLSDLKKYDGKEVFYAVSPQGTVLLKEVDDMTKEEQALFEEQQKNKKKITISTEKLILDPDSLLDMSKIDASYSGKWSGPKAANLGQLKQMFPEHVVDGVVIPFGVFKDHMMQQIPGKDISYWQLLKNIFDEENKALAEGQAKEKVEKLTLSRLADLRSEIEGMTLKKDFVNHLNRKFESILGKPMGQVPVFLRSDTNMEDLPEFTGAGLNLTLFNVVDRKEILEGIKKVWASPYTERSYQWRQQYLKNAEDVYPSILIIPSVNVDRSGVIITKGVNRGSDQDISISFSRGVGGAVEGQSAESYVLYKNGYAELISPGRETKYRTIPASGGSTFKYTNFTEPVLTTEQLRMLHDMTRKITERMDKITGGAQAYDIELGIKGDHIWLFQVRPFVENKGANGSEYLRDLDPLYSKKTIKLDQ